MDKFERIMAVLNGNRPDRLPYSFWHHFRGAGSQGDEAVQAHQKHVELHDVDFLKVMNDLPYPVLGCKAHLEVLDVESFSVLNGDEGGFGSHLKTVRALAQTIGRTTPLVTTVFGPWTVLRRLMMDPVLNVRGVPSFGSHISKVDIELNHLLTVRRDEIVHILTSIALSQANFARQCIEAGASGIFLSVRKDWPNLGGTTDTYETFLRDLDLLILRAANKGWLNILHLCGEVNSVSEFADFPAHVVHWADRLTGPSIHQAMKDTQKTVCGGINNLDSLCSPSGRTLTSELLEACQTGFRRPFIVAPGCAYDPMKVNLGNLHMIRALVCELTAVKN